MKKTTIFFSAAFVALAMTSCIKDRTCVCSDSSGSVDFQYYKVTKRLAKSDCEAKESQYNAYGGSVSCELKK